MRDTDGRHIQDIFEYDLEVDLVSAEAQNYGMSEDLKPEPKPAHNDRLDKIETTLDELRREVTGFKYALPIALTAIGLAFGGVFFVLTTVGSRLERVEAGLSALPKQLSEEFRAMRAEMSAQTSAIANSITATRQVQPQILVIPPPPPAPAAQAPAPPN